MLITSLTFALPISPESEVVQARELQVRQASSQRPYISILCVYEVLIVVQDVSGCNALDRWANRRVADGWSRCSM
jgi:hypothetical protein